MSRLDHPSYRGVTNVTHPILDSRARVCLDGGMTTTRTIQFPGQGTFRTRTQRRYVMVRWSMHYDQAVILKRSDTLATLAHLLPRYNAGEVRVFDTTTGQVVA